MHSGESLLVVLVLLLTFFLICNSNGLLGSLTGGSCCKDKKNVSAEGGAASAADTGGATSAVDNKASVNDSNNVKEIKAAMEHMEYFDTVNDPDEVKQVTDCACADGEPFSFAENAYGAKGLDFKSYIATQAINNDILANHANYINDREKLQGGAYMTGRTMAVDSHTSYDYIPWVGLRRPEWVPVGNPTQVTDADENLFKGNRSWCFRT